MTLTEAKILLERARIPYQTDQYEDEAAYYRHMGLYPDARCTRECAITALVIPSVNGCRHIELQFNRLRGDFRFAELWFGGYSFEMFDHSPDLLEADILETIGRIVDGKLAFITATDEKRRRWHSDACFDLSDTDEVFGSRGFREAVERITREKTWLERLRRQHIRYEIYDWRTHKAVDK